MTGLKWAIQNDMNNDRNVGKLAEFLDAKKVEWTHVSWRMGNTRWLRTTASIPLDFTGVMSISLFKT